MFHGELLFRDFVGGGPDELARAEVLEAERHAVRNAAVVLDGGVGSVHHVVAGVPVGGEREPARFRKRLLEVEPQEVRGRRGVAGAGLAAFEIVELERGGRAGGLFGALGGIAGLEAFAGEELGGEAPMVSARVWSPARPGLRAAGST